MEILEHNMDWDDVEHVRLGLRFIAKFDDRLRDLELSDLNGGNLGWSLLGLRRNGRL